MKIISHQNPFPHLIIEDLYDENELQLIWQELDFLCHSKKWKLPEETGSAYLNDKPSKNNFGLFLDGPNAIYTDRSISSILSVNRKILDKNIVKAYANLSFGYQNLLTTNFDITLISYYENNHFYEKHKDDAIVTALTWFYKEPKSFQGGNLIFSNFNNHKIGVKNNRSILFPSFIIHEVENVHMLKFNPYHGRYCMSQFFHIK